MHSKTSVSIALATKRTGNISADTIRRWEKRGFIHLRRTAGGQRRFSSDDIRKLRELAGLPPDDSAVGAPDPNTVAPLVQP